MEIKKIIEKLREERKIFHSESDFQFALAWAIKEEYKEANIYLERPTQVREKTFYVDIVVELDHKFYPIELKYKTKLFENKSDKFGDNYLLTDQAAQNHGRYDYLKDIYRLEQILKNDANFEKGYAIFLTNDKLYWEEGRNENTFDKAFRIHAGKEVSDLLKWDERTSIETKKEREEFKLSGKYKINWQEYSQIKNCKFMYCCISVKSYVQRQ